MKWAAVFLVVGCAHAPRQTPPTLSPVAGYNQACAFAVAGRAAEAAVELDQLAARDIAFDVDADPDFDHIRATPEFAAVRARILAIRARRVEASQVAFRLVDPDLLTEGITHDPSTGDFFVSSVHQRKIVRVRPDGTATDFVRGGDLFGVLALGIDARRHLLWACSSAMPEMDGYSKDDEGRAALFAFSLADGAQRARLDLPGEGRHNCNDLAVDADGTVFVSDPLAHMIFRVHPGDTDLTPVAQLRSPQGIVIDNGSLLVADYSQGIVRVADGRVTPLDAPEGAVLTGVDGLCRVESGLVAIQNGIEPNRALLLQLDGNRISAARTLDFNHSAYAEPTLCTVVDGDVYYIGAAQWSRFAPGNRQPRQPPVVLKLHF